MGKNRFHVKNIVVFSCMLICLVSAPLMAETKSGEALSVVQENFKTEITPSVQSVNENNIFKTPAEILDQTYDIYELNGISEEEAEMLFSSAMAGIYLWNGGKMIMAANDGLETARLAASRFMKSAEAASVFSNTITAFKPVRITTLKDFLPEIEKRSSRAESSSANYIAKAPSTGKGRPFPVSFKPKTGNSAKFPESVVISEGFENGLDNWYVYSGSSDYDQGQYNWGTTTCSAHSGLYSADGVRGSVGATIACEDQYPSSQINGIAYQYPQYLDISEGYDAWLDFYTLLNTGNDTDNVAVHFYDEATNAWAGWYWWGGTGSSWWHKIFNLRQWAYLGNLKLYSTLEFYLLFRSDSSGAPGWGARVDDITLRTDTYTGLRCSIDSAYPVSGPAPLTVNFTASTANESGTSYYSWHPNNGSDWFTGDKNYSYTYDTPGSYVCSFLVNDQTGKCISSSPVITVTDSSSYTVVGVWDVSGLWDGDTDWWLDTITFNSDGSISLLDGEYAGTWTQSGSTVNFYPYGGCYPTYTGTLNSNDSMSGTMVCTQDSGSGIWNATRVGTCALSCTATVPTTGAVYNSISFTSTATASPSGCATPSYDWNFGDNTSHSTQQNPTHTYTSANTYTWTLTVSGSGATSCTKTGTIKVSSGTCALSCTANVPSTGAVNSSISFSSTATASPSGCTTASYDWNFGDNTSHSTQQNPTHTYTSANTYTWILTVSGSGASNCTKSGTITIGSDGNCITVAGVTFCGDSLSQDSTKYTLTGNVLIQDVIKYSGTLTVTKPNQGNSVIGGNGKLTLPKVTIPNIGPVVLYDGEFNLDLSNGKLSKFLEDNTSLSISGWKVRLKDVGFVSGGISISGDLRIPQYAPGAPKIYAAATIEATSGSGVKLTSGKLAISKIGLAGGLALQDIEIEYDKASNTFNGKGTLKTATMGLQAGVMVKDGCPNGATISILNVPVALGTTGLQIVNYGVDATGLCGTSPFGIGLHTDLTLAGNPDPDLLSLSKLSMMYFPPLKLNGSGELKVLKTKMGNGKFYFNDPDNDCASGLCLRGSLGFPSVDNAWVKGDLDAGFIVKPLKAYGEFDAVLQIPESCNDMGWPFWVCVVLNTYCQEYPCVLASANLSFKIVPGESPEAIMIGTVSVSTLKVSGAVTYNENGDEQFHFHFPYNAETENLIVRMTERGEGISTVVIPIGTPNAYFAVRSADGTMPDFTLTDPNGVVITKSGGSGIVYYEDISMKAAVFTVQDPIPGAWILTSSSVSNPPEMLSTLTTTPPALDIMQANDQNITWQGTAGSSVDLFYSSSPYGTPAGVIASDLSSSGSTQSTAWNTSEVPSGVYYVKGLISDSKNPPVETTYFQSITIVDPQAPLAPVNLSAVKTASNTVNLSWQASPSSDVEGYIIKFSADTSENTVQGQVNVGDQLEYTWDSLPLASEYRFTTAAYDSEGRIGALSNEAVVRTTAALQITSMQKLGNPFRLKVSGTNFDGNLSVKINGAPWTNFKYKNSALIVLKGGPSLKSVLPKGTWVPIVITNPDGGSIAFEYERGSNQWRLGGDCTLTCSANAPATGTQSASVNF